MKVKLFLTILLFFPILTGWAESVNSLLKQAKDNDPEAQYKLCTYYLKQNNNKQAYLWAEKSANNGNAEAQNFMATLTIKTPEISAKWQRKAAIGGQPFAQFMMGVRYATGDGVKKDDPTAYAWLQISLVTNNKNFLAQGYLDEVSKAMTPKQYEEAKTIRKRLESEIRNSKVVKQSGSKSETE